MLQYEIRQILTSFTEHAYHVPIESGSTLVVQIVHDQDQNGKKVFPTESNTIGFIAPQIELKQIRSKYTSLFKNRSRFRRVPRNTKSRRNALKSPL